MTDILSLLVGLAAGVVVGSVVVYLLPYRGLRREHGQAQTELAETQLKNNELQASLLDVQSAAYQERQATMQQQKRLEGQVTEANERNAEQEKQLADLEAQQTKEQQAFLREATRLRGAISRLEQEQVVLQDRHAQENAQWNQERESLMLQDEQMKEQFQGLQKDKVALEARLEQQHEAWERDRLALQIQMNTLEDQLELQRARSPSGDSALAADSALLVEQARAEAAAELNQRQAAWNEERQTLQEQLEREQGERRALRERAGRDILSVGPTDTGGLDLRQQLEQAQRDRQALEEKLAAHDLRAEQERAALETEIEQLMERLLRLQGERRS